MYTSMEFCIDRCANIGPKRGKVISTESITLVDKKQFSPLEDGKGSKHPQVLVEGDTTHGEVKPCLKIEYVQKNKANVGNVVKAINERSVLLLRTC